MISDLSYYMIGLHRHYKNHLPFSGGLLDQPYYYKSSMEIIDARLKDGSDS